MSEVKNKPEVEKEKTPEKEKQTAKLDNWTYDGVRFYGIVSDHPLLPDGEVVHTTRVSWVDWNTKIAETRNTIYILLKANDG